MEMLPVNDRGVEEHHVRVGKQSSGVRTTEHEMPDRLEA